MVGKTHKIIIAGLYLIIVLIVSLHLTVYFINKSAVTSFKKLYSIYSQALSLTVSQMDGETGCYMSADKSVGSDYSNCERFYKIFATNLKVRKYCKNNALSNGCIPVYKKYADTANCAGFSESMMNRYNQAFVMDDSSNFIVFNMPAKVERPIFAIDSNGKLFPNKSGHDLFSVVIMRNSTGSYYFHTNVTYCLPSDRTGIHNLQDVYKF